MTAQSWFRGPPCANCGHEPEAIRLYNSDEAADFLGGAGRISRGTVGVWRRSGWLRNLRLGNGYWFSKDALNECLSLKNYTNRIQESEEEDAK